MIVVLVEPEIPPNTGNIARLCAAFATELHLIEPLGFSLDNRQLKRAGLDYWPNVQMRVWPDWQTFHSAQPSRRLVLATTKGGALLPAFRFEAEDGLVFGPETRGLGPDLLCASPHHIRIPMRTMPEGGARSLNLSSACAIVLYAALLSSGELARFA